MASDLVRIKDLLADLEEGQFLSLVEERLQANEDPMAIVEACRDGMEIVGKRFADCEYFVSDLIVSAELFNSAMNILGPKLPATDSASRTKVVVGTVKGDIHDIGKNIVVAMLRCNGFEVYDVGVDVSTEAFINKVKETGATVLGLSGLLTVAFASMEEVIQRLEEAGLKDKVKVMIGGGMINDFVRDQVGADAWGHDAIEAIKLAESLSAEVKTR